MKLEQKHPVGDKYLEKVLSDGGGGSVVVVIVVVEVKVAMMCFFQLDAEWWWSFALEFDGEVKRD